MKTITFVFMEKELIINQKTSARISVEIVNDRITLNSNSKWHHDKISFIPDNPKEVYKKLVADLEMVYMLFNYSRSITFLPQKFNYLETKKKNINDMSREEMIKYIKNGSTNLKLNHDNLLYFPIELENKLNKDLIQCEYKRMKHMFKHEDICDSKMIEIKAQRIVLTHSLTVDENQPIYTDNNYVDCIIKNVNIIITHLEQNNYKFIHSIIINTFFIVDELVCGIVIYAK